MRQKHPSVYVAVATSVFRARTAGKRHNKASTASVEITLPVIVLELTSGLAAVNFLPELYPTLYPAQIKFKVPGIVNYPRPLS